MKKFLIYAIVLIAVIAMAKTVPDKKAHKKAMMEAVKAYVDEEASERGMGDNILTDLGKGIVNKTIEKVLNSKLEMHDYLVYNTTYVMLQGEEQLLSVGLLGHVFTFDKQMLREKLEESAQEKAAVKQNERELKELQKEKKKREKELAKERRKQEKDSIREAKRLQKELRRQEKERERAAQ